MNLSETLFRLARRIAPDRRKSWIDAMQTEAAQSRSRTGWAIGAVATASRERLTDLAASGALVRAIGGTFVMGSGLAVLPYLLPVLIHIRDRHLFERNPGNAVVGITIFTLIIVGLVGTGAAIMIAGRNRLARVTAKAIVVVMGTGLGIQLTWGGWLSLKPHHHITLIQHELIWLSLLAGPALLVAVAALLLKRPRLFLAAALTALGAEAGQWLIELSHHGVSGIIPALIGVYASCLPTLLMLAATGLVIAPTPRRS